MRDGLVEAPGVGFARGLVAAIHIPVEDGIPVELQGPVRGDVQSACGLEISRFHQRREVMGEAPFGKPLVLEDDPGPLDVSEDARL
jgi:hypothetical protein